MKSIAYSEAYPAAIRELKKAQRLLRKQQAHRLPEAQHARAVFFAELAVQAAIDAHCAQCVAAAIGQGLTPPPATTTASTGESPDAA